MTNATIQVRLNVAIVLAVAAVGLAVGCSVMSYGAAVTKASERIAIIEKHADEQKQAYEQSKKYYDLVCRQMIEQSTFLSRRVAVYNDQLAEKYDIILTDK